MGRIRDSTHTLLDKVREGNPTVPGRSTARCRTTSLTNRGFQPENSVSTEKPPSSSSAEASVDDMRSGDGLPQVPRFQSDSGKNLRNR